MSVEVEETREVRGSLGLVARLLPLSRKSQLIVVFVRDRDAISPI